MDRGAERAWKHRFAQTLYEFFCMSGLERSAALDDAYAHADAQFLVRGAGNPEDEARSALTWIRANMADTAANSADNAAQAPNPHNGGRHHPPFRMDLLPDVSD